MSEGPRLKSGDTTFEFEKKDGEFVPVVYLNKEGSEEEVLRAGGFIELRLGETRPAGRITAAGTRGGGFEFEGDFPDAPDWKFSGDVSAMGDIADRFDCEMELVYTGTEPVEYGVRVRFDVQDGGVPRWMVPGMFYKDNRPAKCVRKYPRYQMDAGRNAAEDFTSNYWAFRSDRSSCPSVFCWTDNYTSCLAVPPHFGDSVSGVGFKGDGNETTLFIDFPYVEEPVQYAPYRGAVPGRGIEYAVPRRTIKLKFSIYVDEFNLHAYDYLIRDLYVESEDEGNPWVPKNEADALLSYGLYKWHYDPEHRVLYETCYFDAVLGEGKRLGQVHRPHMHVSWVSGIPYAYALWRYGRESKVDEYAEAGLSVIDKTADEGVSPCGIFYSQWTLENGWDTGWNPKKEWLQSRTTAEAVWFLIQAVEYAGECGMDRPNWSRAAKSNLDFAVKVQRADGNMGSYYNINTGEVEEWDGAAGLMWIPALLAGARYFKDDRYREAAIKAGRYYASFVEDEYIYGAPEDVHLTPTSEDGYNAVIAYVHLYEADKKEEWLELAKSAADWTATFRWTYNVRFDGATLLGAYDFRTLGGDAASPSNNHLHDYGLICHPELLRLWEYTGDTYYLSRAEEHLACFRQFIAREDGDFNARKGMITEQWYYTDWRAPKGSMLTLAHSWCAGLILYANRYTREFGDLIIDADSREVYMLDSVVVEGMEDADPDLSITIVNPFITAQSLKVRHSKLGIVGTIELEPMEKARYLIGLFQPKLEQLEDTEDMWK